MPWENRLTDVTVGAGSHGQDCCGHTIVGVRITGSPNVDTNKLATSRAMADLAAHSCPHCPINMCALGSPNDYTNSLPTHRLSDMETEFCGAGISTTGSPNVCDNRCETCDEHTP